MNANNFSQGHLMEIEWLVIDVTAVFPPRRAGRAILGVILELRVFDQFGTHLWSGRHFVI